MEEMQKERMDAANLVAGSDGGDDAIEQRTALKRKSQWVRIAFLVVFVLVAAMPVVNGCNGAVTISSLELMTLNLPGNTVEHEEYLPYTVSSVLVLWVAVITMFVGVFRTTESVQSRPLTIGGGILFLYLLIVASFVFKDEQTAGIVSLDLGWFLMLGVGALFVLHHRVLPWILAKLGVDPVTILAPSPYAYPPPIPHTAPDNADNAAGPITAAAASEQAADKKVRRKLKTWQKALIAVGSVILLLIIVAALLVYMEYSRQQEAIQLTKDVEFGGSTWGEFAKNEIEANHNKEYQWLATNYGEDNIYFVQFVDEEGWGHQFETDIEEGTVKWINEDEYLSRKYGVNSVYPGEYELMTTDDGTFSMQIDGDADGGATFRYALKGEVVNNSGKHISQAEVGYDVMLIYPEKTIHAKNSGSYIIDRDVSARYPWKPGQSIPISFASEVIDAAYLRTEPAYFVCQISVFAEDLTGYEFKRGIAEIDLSDRWESLKGIVTKQKEIVKQAEGVFTWENANAQARITIRNLYANTYAVTGEAFYGTQSEFGPNMGSLDFTAELSGSRLTHTEDTDSGDSYTIDINIGASGITVRESGSGNDFGMNVSFAGEYRKE